MQNLDWMNLHDNIKSGSGITHDSASEEKVVESTVAAADTTFTNIHGNVASPFVGNATRLKALPKKSARKDIAADASYNNTKPG